jgi:hypothetical protein
MKRTLAAIGLILLLAGPAAALTDQQAKMKTCNAQAGQKKLAGDARKQFMSECLSAKGDAPKVSAQQQKMKDCNVQAGQQKLKGEARKKFMSTCLSGN